MAQALLSKSIFNRPVEDFSPSPVLLFSPDTPLSEVLPVLREDKMGVMAIGSESEIQGIATERDLLNRVDLSAALESIPISSIMTPSPDCLKQGDSVLAAAELMAFRNIRQVPIIYKDNGKVELKCLGIKEVLALALTAFGQEIEKLGPMRDPEEQKVVTDEEGGSFDVVAKTEDGQNALTQAVFHRPIRRVVSADPVIVEMRDSMLVTIEKMRKQRQGAAVVVEFGTSVKGIVTERDFIRKVFGHNLDLADTKISSIMTANPHYLYGQHKVAYAYNNLMTFGYRNILVVNDDKYPVAIVSLLDLLNYLFRKLS